MLTGQEVKSCREGHVNLSGSYVSFLGGTPTLKKTKIQQYRYAADIGSYDPERDRVLLLKRSESDRLRSKVEEKGVTILPLEVRAARTIKILLGLGRGRKKYDKRERIREREVQRKLKRGEEV